MNTTHFGGSSKLLTSQPWASQLGEMGECGGTNKKGVD
jgi:hypothetical protein